MSFDEIRGLLISQFGESVIIESNQEVIQPYFLIETSKLVEVCTFLHENEKTYFDMLSCITGIDNGEKQGTMEVIYQLYSIPYNISLVLKVIIEREKGKLPSVPSLSPIWKTANWLERETYDLLGIHFEGHPDLRRILLPADWEGFPLRKDYSEQEYYHGIKVKY